MATSLLRRLIVASSLAATALSLEVTPGSDCAALCQGSLNGTTTDTSATGTNSSDIVCDNKEYEKTATGIKFKNCVECLQKSDASREAESDASWFLCE